MIPDSAHLEYQFGNYCLPNWEQVIYKNGERQPISTNLYYLLLILVENAGHVVSKDKILATAWPREVVTDTILAKQILRLRQLLKDHQREHPFIETHRGIGYRFTAPVTVKAPLEGVAKPAGRNRTTWLMAAGLFSILLLSLLVGYIGYSSSQPTITATPDAPVQSDKPIKVAVLPLGDDQDWLNKGGRDYLAEKLGQNPKISSVSPPAKWLSDGSTESQAIDLTAYGNLNYSCLVTLSESNGEYRADVKLLSNSTELSATEVYADSLPTLFDRTNTWIRNSLALHANLEDLAPDSAESVDSYALQSYLHGQFELAANENRKKAAEYFQAAVARDPDFLEAWAKLARNYMSLGEFEQAISIARSVLARPDIQFSPQLLLELNYIIGISYGRLHNGEKSLQYLRRAQELIATSNDAYAKMPALEALQTLAMYEGRYADAEALAIQSLAIAESDYHLPNYLANLHINAAKAIDMSGDRQRSLAHINKALELWKQTNNANGLMKSYYLLTYYDYMMGYIDEGIEVLSEADPYVKRSSVVFEKAFYLQNGGLLLNLRGQFNLSNQYMEQLHQLAAETNNPVYLALSELVGVHQLYVQNRFSEATDHALAILTKFEAEGTAQSAFPDILSLAILTSSRGKPPAETRVLIKKFDATYSSHRQRLRNDLRRAEGHLAIREGQIEEGLQQLKEVEDYYRNQNSFHISDYIATERLEVMLDHPAYEYKQLLASTEKNAGYGYLLWKIKAQFLAREGDFSEAVSVMNENKLRANQLWTAEDQLQLEDYQARINQP